MLLNGTCARSGLTTESDAQIETGAREAISFLIRDVDHVKIQQRFVYKDLGMDQPHSVNASCKKNKSCIRTVCDWRNERINILPEEA